MGLRDDEIHRFGVIAQDLQEIHPESVNTNGEFMTVDQSRIFFENIVVVQELSRMHENLEKKMNERVRYIIFYLRSNAERSAVKNIVKR